MQLTQLTQSPSWTGIQETLTWFWWWWRQDPDQECDLPTAAQQAAWQTKTPPRTALAAASTAFSFKVMWLVPIFRLALARSHLKPLLIRNVLENSGYKQTCRQDCWVVDQCLGKGKGRQFRPLNLLFSVLLNNLRELVNPSPVLPYPFWPRLGSGQESIFFNRVPRWSDNLENIIKIQKAQKLNGFP